MGDTGNSSRGMKSGREGKAVSPLPVAIQMTAAENGVQGTVPIQAQFVNEFADYNRYQFYLILKLGFGAELTEFFFHSLQIITCNLKLRANA